MKIKKTIQDTKTSDSILPLIDEYGVVWHKYFPFSEDVFPLSFEEQSIWFENQKLEQNQIDPFIEITSLIIEGNVSVSAIDKAVYSVLTKLPNFRSSFKNMNDIPIKVIHSEVRKILSPNYKNCSYGYYYDFSNAEKRDHQYENVLKQYQFQKMDLSKDNLADYCLIKLKDDYFQLFFRSHHIVSDDISQFIVINTFLDSYREVNSEKSLPKCIPYERSISEILKTRQQQVDNNNARSYWKNMFLKEISSIEIPLDYNPSSKAIDREGLLIKTITKDNFRKLKHVSRKAKVTPFVFLFTIYKLLLYKLSNSEFITLSVAMNVRSNKTKEEPGYFINILPIITTFKDKNQRFIDLLAKVRANIKEVSKVRDFPFSEVAKLSRFNNFFFHNPLNRFWVTYTKSLDFSETINNITFTFKPVRSSNSPNDFGIIFVEKKEEISIECKYNTDIFSSKTAENMIQRFCLLLEQVVDHPEKSIAILTALTKQEQKELLFTYNQTQSPYPKEKTIHLLFEEQALKTPNNIAVSFPSINENSATQLTYKELNHKANQLAHYFIKTGVLPNTLVAICMDRSLDMIVGLLGVLKAGAAYVPIDPNYPKNRIEFMLKDAQPSVLLTQNALKSAIPKTSSLLIYFDLIDFDHFSTDNPMLNIDAKSLAYVIYTSGSTGNPKGVMVEHKNSVALISWSTKYFTQKQLEHVLASTSFTFDLSVFEIFVPLSIGTTLYLVDDILILLESSKLLDFPITLINSIPSAVMELYYNNAIPNTVTTINLAGEKLAQSNVELLYTLDHVHAINDLYGPTEDTTYTTCSSRLINGFNTIGKPIDNTQLYILDENHLPVPKGVPGELYISGDGLARGYLNQKELTKEKFIPNPFIPNTRMYKTGDLVKYLEDGNIAFLGRVDHQVKIRGYRIELGEIEHHLLALDFIKKAIVVVKEDDAGHKILVAYVLSTQPIESTQVKAILSSQLPEYMLPNIITKLEELPLMPNGKVDRKSLSSLAVTTHTTKLYVAPRNEKEEKLATIFSEVLNIDYEQVGINDNFFELGGDSILSIQIASRLKQIDLPIQIKDLFVHQTINALSNSFTTIKHTKTVSSEHTLATGVSNLNPIQHWFFEEVFENNNYWNQSVLLKSDKSIDIEILKNATVHLAQHHDSLRLRYIDNLHYTSKPNILVEEVTLRLQTPKELALDITAICNQHQSGLNIQEGPLLKVILMQTAENQCYNRLFIVSHHLIIDGVSWRILIEDLTKIIVSIQEFYPIVLDPKSTSFKYYASLLKSQKSITKFEVDLNYWKKVVSTPIPPLPKDYLEKKVLTKHIKKSTITFDKNLTNKLLTKVNKTYNTQINDILLCALSLSLQNWTTNDHYSLYLENHGRNTFDESIDINRTIGWFTSMYPVILSLHGIDQLSSAIKSIKEQLRKVPPNGLSYGILRYLHPENDIQKSLHFQTDITFNYLGQFDNVLANNKLFDIADEDPGLNHDPNNHRSTALTINAILIHNCLSINLEYCTQQYESKTIDTFLQIFHTQLNAIIEHCCTSNFIEFTPSDFPLSKLNQKELDSHISQNINSKYIENIYPLTPLQEGMLFHTLMDKAQQTYIEQFVCKINTPIDVNVFEQSWAHLITKYSILRTSMLYKVANKPHQIVHFSVDTPFEYIDLQKQHSKKQKNIIENYVEQDYKKSFDLTKAPLMRITLIKCSEKEYTLIWTYHHILMDGWSLPILLNELLITYKTLTHKEGLKIVPDNFEDFIRYLSKYDHLKAKIYWKKYMEGCVPTTICLQRSQLQANKLSNIYNEQLLDLPKALTQNLNIFAKEQHITMSTLIQGAWAIILQCYSQSKEVIFGVTSAGRPIELTNVETRVGLFINTLPLKVVCDENISIGLWLKQIQNQQLQMKDYEYSSLSDIHSWSDIPSNRALFDSVVVFENYPLRNVEKDDLLKIENISIREQTNYPVTLMVSEMQALKLRLSYNQAYYEDYVIGRMLKHIQIILTQFITHKKLGTISILEDKEQKELLFTYNQTQFPYPKEKTIHLLFEEQVLKTPTNIAVSFPSIDAGSGTQLSYNELNHKANQLAHYFIKTEVQPNSLVAVCMDRSLDMIVGLLGILKVGAAYVPIDPNYPKNRIELMLKDAQPSVLLTQNALKSRIPKTSGQLISFDCIDFTPFSTNNPTLNIDAKSLAYVIYTSGSTGNPKGVMVEHKSLINLLSAMGKKLNSSDVDHLLALTSISFDIHTLELFLPLTIGARLSIASESIAKSATQLAKVIKFEHITHIQATPSTWNMLFSNGWKPEQPLTILCGGEAITASLKEKLIAYSSLTLYNVYGPTETTVWSTINKLNSSNNTEIGRPLANTQLYILDENHLPVPKGVPGELYISGDGLARGYLNQKELTKEMFIPNPFIPNTRMYKTGDLVKYLEDGNIDFLGRIDHQVKIRGHRIELGEIEFVACALEEIESCVVLDIENNETKSLHLFLTENKKTTRLQNNGTHNNRINYWKEIWDSNYALENTQPEFNTVGWNSSYTKEEISKEEMQEWQIATIDLILSTTPKNIFEIGCGSGLLLYKMLPHCKTYFGIDNAQNIITDLNLHFKKKNIRKAQVACFNANNVKIPTNQNIDTVIINSVIQYFPTIEYLNEVIKNAIASITTFKGTLIIGDVRNLALQKEFYFSTLSPLLPKDIETYKLKHLIIQQKKKETELLLHPNYFLSLLNRFNEVCDVKILIKKGGFENEMTKFRYDVIVNINRNHSTVHSPHPKIKEIRWTPTKNLNSIINTINDSLDPIIRFVEIPNARLKKEIHFYTSRTVDVNNKKYSNYIDPNDVWKICEQTAYDFEITPSNSPHHFDVIINKSSIDILFSQLREQGNLTIDHCVFANNPLEINADLEFIKNVKKHLSRQLPEYMLPNIITKLEELPLTPNGKVDRKTLSSLIVTANFTEQYIAPRNEREQQLVTIFSDVLNIDYESIGIHDNFFELGGHSLLATQLIARIRSEMTLECSLKALFEYPTVEGLLDYLKEHSLSIGIDTIPVFKNKVNLPLSFAQERLWFLDQFEESTQSYHMPALLLLKGPLNTEVLRSSLISIIERHEALRTNFITNENGDAFQHIGTAERFELNLIKINKSKLLKAVNKELVIPFDLEKDLLFRSSLYTTGESEHYLLVNMHHIISDGWSTGVLVNEFIKYYSATIQNNPINLPNLPIQYGDFTLWQKNRLQDGALNGQLVYWKKQLAGAEVLELPTSYSRPVSRSYKGNHISFCLDADLTKKIHELGKNRDITLFMTLLSGFSVLMHRYSNQDDIIIGSPIAGRNFSELEGLIGFFTNTLALRQDFSQNPSFASLLQQVKKTTLEAYENQEFPFEKIVETIQPVRDTANSPLFQVMFVLQNTPNVTLNLPGLEIEEIDITNSSAKFDLTLNLTEKGNRIEGSFEYATDLFSAPFINAMVSHFKLLLKGIVEDIHAPINQINFLSKQEQKELLFTYNQTKFSYPKEKTIHLLFEEQALKTPNNIAVSFPSINENSATQLTYKELNHKANQLAHYLIKMGVLPDSLVAICIDRSLDMIVGLLGTLKAGAAYVPIDPTYPKNRIKFMIEDAQPSALLTQNALKSAIPNTNSKLICLDLIDFDHFSTDNPMLNIDVKSLAYVIYTSGSTGNPKGVMVEHRSVVNLTYNQTRIFSMSSEDCILQFASFGFDAATFEIILALMNGARIALTQREIISDASALQNEIIQQKISVVVLTPAMLSMLDTSKLNGLRLIISAGELCLLKPVKSCMSNQQFFNAYGPTETTICASTYVCSGNETDTPPIGRPIGNVQLYILDKNNMPVPKGVQGELCISGDGLARGYLNQKELTEEKFISNPFIPNTRMYKTGDLVKYLEDGNIDFLGRIDNQIKIRGHRIELGEIEHHLLAINSIKEAVVIARKDNFGYNVLVAYIVSAQSIESPQIKSIISDQLPEYMLPNTITQLDALPLTPNGKIDRKHLSSVEIIANSTKQYIAPRNKIEEKLATIFSDVLSIKYEQVGIYDDFFELGGHSLLAIQLILHLNKTFVEKQIPLKTLFSKPTIEQLAVYLTNNAVESVDGFIDLESELKPHLFKDCVHHNVGNYQVPENILITGVTGFVGLHLLIELLSSSSAVLHCVIRGKDQLHCELRLKNALKNYELEIPEKNWKRIIIFQGDLEKKQLGIHTDTYRNLESKIDLIIHNGAFVNHLYGYNQLKKANVNSTSTLIRLAKTTKKKKFIFISTIGTVGNSNEQYLNEKTDLKSLQIKQTDGYIASKWVSEMMVIDSDIDYQIHRLGRVGGSVFSTRGPLNDMVYRYWKTCLILKKYPKELDLWYEDIRPINQLVDIMAMLSMRADCNKHIFHLNNGKLTQVNILLKFAQQSKQLKEIEMVKWIQLLEREALDGNMLPFYPYLEMVKGLLPKVDEMTIKKQMNRISNQMTMEFITPTNRFFEFSKKQLTDYLKQCEID